MAHINPEIENAHGKQDQRHWPRQHQHDQLASQPRNGLAQVGGQDAEKLYWNISGDNDSGGGTGAGS